MKYTSAVLFAAGAAASTSSNAWDPWTETTTTKSTTTSSSAASSWTDWDPKSSSTTASSWADWDGSSSSPVGGVTTKKTTTPSTAATWTDWSDPSKSTSAAWGAVSPVGGNSGTVTITETTTVYKSTVFVGPGQCTATVYLNAGGSPTSYSGPSITGGAWGPGGSPVGGQGTSTVAGGWPAGGSPVGGQGTSTVAGGWPAGGSPVGGQGTSTVDGGWPAGGSPTGGVGTSTVTGGWPNGGSPSGPDGSSATGGLNGQGGHGSQSYSTVAKEFPTTLWGVHPANPTNSDPPEYPGWSDWTGDGGSTGGGNGTSGGNGTWNFPPFGSSASNVTVPQNGTTWSSCNGPNNRNQWCNNLDINSDYYQHIPLTGKQCVYDFTITNTTLNYDGSGEQLALAVNGQVPGPLIECNWGDEVVITVSNQMQDNGTAIHWHGVRQIGSNDQDGVPGVTECAIAPGDSRTYTWIASSYGTSWYHSHWATQYGDGIRGPIIIHGPASANYDIDMGTVMIDDVFNQTAAQTNSIISTTGPGGTANYLLNGKNVRPDLSAGQHALWSIQPGKKHLFRFINSASQNMWSVHLDNHVFQVIAADFVPIVPYTTEWLDIGIGQRFDVIVEADQAVDNYFLRAVTQLLCPSACDNSGLGNANGIVSYQGAVTGLLPTSTPGNLTLADFNICQDEPITSLVPVLKKSAGSSSAFTAQAETIEAGNVSAVLTSDEGVVFQWYINNGAINVNYTQPTLQTLATYGSNSTLISNPIVLKQANQWYYFVIQNAFFAYHPIHLHGHDFALLGQGDGIFTPDLVKTLNFDSPMRRDTAMLAGSAGPQSPAGYTVIGFQSDNPGAWLMHCHIVWHVDGGLALQWIERPDDIDNSFASKSSFTSECSNYNAFCGTNDRGIHLTGESGLKRRYMDDMLSGNFGHNVVRHEHSEHHYLDSHAARRGLGDGANHRHL